MSIQSSLRMELYIVFKSNTVPYRKVLSWRYSMAVYTVLWPLSPSFLFYVEPLNINIPVEIHSCCQEFAGTDIYEIDFHYKLINSTKCWNQPWAANISWDIFSLYREKPDYHMYLNFFSWLYFYSQWPHMILLLMYVRAVVLQIIHTPCKLAFVSRLSFWHS